MAINNSHFSPEDYLPAERVNNILDSIKSNEENIAKKADASTTLEGYGITDAYTKEVIDETINTVYLTMNNQDNQKADKAETISGYGITDAYTKSEIDELLNTKQYKTVAWTWSEATDCQFSLNSFDNIECRYPLLVESISIDIPDDVYSDTYTSGLSFNSGEIPTSINYTGSGILNWVGTDCTVSEGYSIFQPSPNTHYDIVFYFNGTQFVGLVNGFVPSIGNVVSE